MKSVYGVLLVLIAIIVIVSGVAAYYYYQYSQSQSANQQYVAELRRLGASYYTNVVIDYGNDTYYWYNQTKVQPGWNLYTVTLLVTNGEVNATCCEYGSHFVTGIGGIQNSKSEYWFLWNYTTSASWQTASVGADEITVTNNSIFAWTYCGIDPSYNPTCRPP
ncbi:MAG TPA: hypothetical protein VFF30_18200 [Nitrososphaerales archaeon]|nr:hypothetical protein [Nitrososphaerales archaeon]